MNDDRQRQATAFIVIACIAVAVLLSCESPAQTTPPGDDERQCPYPKRPPVDPPLSARTRNYAGGSCAHASIIMLLHHQGKDKEADYWRRNYSGGAGVYDLARIAAKMGLDYAVAKRGDAKFMQWASDTGRGAAIHWHRGGGLHAVAFCGYHNGNAMIIDNNKPENFIRVPKQDFIDEWKSYGGYAMTIVYPRPAPKPW